MSTDNFLKWLDLSNGSLNRWWTFCFHSLNRKHVNLLNFSHVRQQRGLQWYHLLFFGTSHVSPKYSFSWNTLVLHVCQHVTLVWSSILILTSKRIPSHKVITYCLPFICMIPIYPLANTSICIISSFCSLWYGLPMWPSFHYLFLIL